MTRQKNIKLLALLPVIILSLCFIGGCKARYRYFSFKSQAEEALQKKNLKKSAELYSIIYQHENSEKTVDTERTTWAFYRLGVIAEVSGDIRMAKGYYWGDKIDEGFYQEHARVDWLAQAAWNHLDEGLAPRSLEEILALEARGPTSTAVVPDRKKREFTVPDAASGVRSYANDNNPKPVRSRTFLRTRTPPKPGTPEPFRVFY